MLLTLAMFAAACAAIAYGWNRWFRPVSWSVVALLAALCALHQAETLLTDRVAIPGVSRFSPDPWRVIDAPAVRANNGIVFTQLAPWTRIARDQLLSGMLPLWNRHSAGGTPLMANQQTAIFHPFTLLGLPLTVGKAFTLSAALRLFVVLFFTFVFLRGFGLGDAASLFGAVAYAFCTFHVIWLLFPLGLATMMLPVALAGARELCDPANARRRAPYVLLTLGLALSVLGGHPESALWVWIATAAFIVYVARTRLFVPASAFVVAALLTAFFWYPTLRALQTTERFQKFHDRTLNPADHGLSYEWLLPLVAPNVLGNPLDGTYAPPRGAHPAVLNDYGEVASGYAGLLTLALALAAPFLSRRPPLWFALGLMLFALLTIAEAPLWRDVVRSVPLAGVSLQQRLRVLWDLGVCIAAAITIDALAGRRRVLYAAMAACAAAFAAVYLLRDAALDFRFGVPLATLALFALRPKASVATAAVFLDLVAATWRYNPPARPEHVYPVTGAIDFLQRQEKPSRMAAWGWSFIPETPGWYGLEDVKTTDPVQHFAYMFLLRGYLEIDPASPDLVLRNVERAWVDYLNVRWLYVPREHALQPAGFVERYRGPDGAVLENAQVLPRYFLVREARIEPDLGAAVALSRFIPDFRAQALVDRKPAGLPERFAGGEVRVVRYEPHRTELATVSRGWNLLVTSDTHWPGWKARIDGKRHEVVTVNGAFIGVFVPPGAARVELWYWPDELTHGLAASMAGVAMLASALALIRRQRR